MIRPRPDPKPWRNDQLPPPSLPEPHPDRWQWLPGEVVFGPPPSAPTPPTEPEAKRQ
jgi:hypothetical protein